MSLADQFAAVQTRKPDFDQWVTTHPEGDLIRAQAANAAITHADFLRIVKTAGAAVGKDKLADWRKANGYAL